MAAELADIEALYRSSFARYRNALATVTGSYDSARDAVQHAFAQAIAKRRDFRGDGSLAAWIWKIALRHALRLRSDFAETSLNGSFAPSLVDPTSDPELSMAIRALPPRRRLVVFLRYFAELSYAEIAEIAGMSEGTVAATLNQARTELRTTLEKGVTHSDSR